MSATFLQQPLTMLFLSICGMATGLAIDSGSLPPDALANLCLAQTGGGLLSHLRILPATHGLMLIGALVAAAIGERTVDRSEQARSTRLAEHLADVVSAVAMAIGMLLGGFFGASLLVRLGVGSGFAALITSMVLGMASGMMLAVPLYHVPRPRHWTRARRRSERAAINSSARATDA
jgi:integral membrane sensor domain MASE1